MQLSLGFYFRHTCSQNQYRVSKKNQVKMTEKKVSEFAFLKVQGLR